MKKLPRPTGWVMLGALVAMVVVVAGLALIQNREQYIGNVVVGPNPVAVVLDEPRRRAYVLNRGSLNNRGEPTGKGALTVINTESGEVLYRVETGIYPTASAVDSDSGRLFVANRGFHEPGGLAPEQGTVNIIDPTSGQILDTLKVGIGPHALLVDEQSGRVLVLNSGERGKPGSVSILDSNLGTVLGEIPVDSYPADVIIDSHNAIGFVANYGSNSISILDLMELRVLKTLRIGNMVQGEAGTLARLALDANRARIFALNFSYPPVFEGSGPNNGKLTIVDPQRTEILRTVAMTNPLAIALSTTSSQVFVTGYENGEGWLMALDGRNGNTLWNAKVGVNPIGIIVDAEQGKLYVPNYDDGTIRVIRMRDGQLLCTLSVGKQPIAVAVGRETQRVFVINAPSNSLSILKSIC